MKISVNAILARCILYFFSILFTINVGVGAYFVYFQWYLKKVVTRVTRTQAMIY